MKKLISTLAIASLSLSLASCSNSNSTAMPTSTPTGASISASAYTQECTEIITEAQKNNPVTTDAQPEAKSYTASETPDTLTLSDDVKNVEVSNLVSTQQQERLCNILLNNNISRDSIRKFFTSVLYYNNVTNYEFLNDTTTLEQVRYDSTAITALHEKANPDFGGTNCRITAFTLLKDSIDLTPVDFSGDTEDDSANWFLGTDTASINTAPFEFITQEEKNTFSTLFLATKTELTTNKDTHIGHIKKQMENNKVTFSNNKASLISVHMADEEDQALFIGHAGVLLPNDNGYVFVEKLAFDAPYQAIYFSSEEQVYNYLTAAYQRFTSKEMGAPILFKNNKEITIK
ncbi:MAG: DUF4300 family protein [Actinomycetaceae bacterium]|nr:DUF4300 family protein [Actinomycetaceae bacterium]